MDRKWIHARLRQWHHPQAQWAWLLYGLLPKDTVELDGDASEHDPPPSQLGTYHTWRALKVVWHLDLDYSLWVWKSCRALEQSSKVQVHTTPRFWKDWYESTSLGWLLEVHGVELSTCWKAWWHEQWASQMVFNSRLHCQVNEHRVAYFHPSSINYVDESISRWYGLGGSWINKGLPMCVAIDRKPEDGCEIQDACCAKSNIMMRLKLVKSATEEESLREVKLLTLTCLFWLCYFN